MKTLCYAALAACATAYCAGPEITPLSAGPALTIYNQQFAVVREILPLSLRAGSNAVHFSGVTAHVEPDSVILRDAAGHRTLAILEQNYRADTISQGLLLAMYEGKELQFTVPGLDGRSRIITGKVIRSGYVPHYSAMSRFGSQYQAQQMAMSYEGSGQPIVEVDGQLQFTLPGQPVFPALGDDSILHPTLDWTIHSPEAARFDAELSYVSGGLSWNADYNIIAPESGDVLDLVGWVTIENQSGKQFDQARIKLVAGDVSKLQSGSNANEVRRDLDAVMKSAAAPQVTERSFDEYHLYTLPRPTTLRDRESKQVEFLRAQGIPSKQLYIYDGSAIDARQYGYQRAEDIRNNPQYGTQSNPSVWVMREFLNSEANHLGMALPRGRVRFYRRDRDGQMEFTGENLIGHTPKDERVRIYTGNAFDVAGERRQVNYRVDTNRRTVDESFEIKLRNHKKERVAVRVVEHLYRWSNWAIEQESDQHRKIDSRTIEYEVSLQPDQEKTITYSAHYYW